MCFLYGIIECNIMQSLGMPYCSVQGGCSSDHDFISSLQIFATGQLYFSVIVCLLLCSFIPSPSRCFLSLCSNLAPSFILRITNYIFCKLQSLSSETQQGSLSLWHQESSWHPPTVWHHPACCRHLSRSCWTPGIHPSASS